MLSCSLAHWGRAQQGAVGVPGAPQAQTDPCPPRHILHQQGWGAQALLSAGLSPRVVASSLKEGRSLGLGAQQRCISLARREGQPSGCGSFVFPDCRPGMKEKSKGPLARGMILSGRCKESSSSPCRLENSVSPARPVLSYSLSGLLYHTFTT